MSFRLLLVSHQVLFQISCGQVALTLTIMPLFIKEMISLNKPQVLSNFLHHEVYKPVQQLNDVCHIHSTVNSVKFEAAHTVQASVCLMTNCACAIMVINYGKREQVL